MMILLNNIDLLRNGHQGNLLKYKYLNLYIIIINKLKLIF